MVRYMVLEQARRMRLFTSDLGPRPKVPVYVNDNLFPELKKRLGQATAKKQESVREHLWVSNGEKFAQDG